MIAQTRVLIPPSDAAVCRVPLDARHFDSSSIVAAPNRDGREVVVARFELPVSYCGILEYFAQFTDEQARDAAAIGTPALEWSILINREPADPYLNLRHIVNPWGAWNYPIALRLPANARLEFAVRRVAPLPGAPASNISRIGGRVAGRYWYSER